MDDSLDLGGGVNQKTALDKLSLNVHTTRSLLKVLYIGSIQKQPTCEMAFSNFSCIFFSNLNYNCSNLLDISNLQEKVKKKHSATKNLF